MDYNKALSAYAGGSNALASTLDTRNERNSRWQKAPSYLDDFNDRDFGADLAVPSHQTPGLAAIGSAYSLNNKRPIQSAIRRPPNTQLISSAKMQLMRNQNNPGTYYDTAKFDLL